MQLRLKIIQTDSKASHVYFVSCRLYNLVTSRQKDKETLSSLERKFAEEKKGRNTLEQQLVAERKAKKNEDAAAARAVALVTAR